jgi:hypothetical protein
MYIQLGGGGSQSRIMQKIVLEEILTIKKQDSV